MFDLKWLLNLIYGVTKLSGFLFISIDFSGSEGLKSYKHFWNWILFGINFGFSLFSLSYDGVLAVIDVTHSRIMEVGLNLLVYTTINITWFVKVLNVVHGRTFFTILSNFQWVELKVGVSIISFQSNC